MNSWIDECRQVVPLNDAHEHSTRVPCDCEPKRIIAHDGTPILVHNSYDGREAVEEARTILGYGVPYGENWKVVWEKEW